MLRVLPAIVGGVVLIVASGFLMFAGLQDLALCRSGPRHDYAAQELPAGVRGVVAVAGCVRHDLAVGVTDGGRVYPLGTPAAGAGEGDVVYTPLAAPGDCDEARPPARLYALVQDDDGLDNTIGRVFARRVTPPPVPAIVDGVVGYGRAKSSARAAGRATGAVGLPVIAKGKRPGVAWVAVVTAAAGLHGLLLTVVAAWLWRRRRLRKRAQDEFSDEENAFYEGGRDV